MQSSFCLLMLTPVGIWEGYFSSLLYSKVFVVTQVQPVVANMK